MGFYESSRMEQNFRGRYEVTIDEKSRLRLPSSLRGQSTKKIKFVMTNNLVGASRCLDILTTEEFKKLESKIAKMPQMKREVQVFQRYYLSAAHVVEVDTSGRLLIPFALREYAGLKEDLVLVGMGSKIEVWDKSEWTLMEKRLEADFEGSQKVISDL
jgi:MraZ protein